MATDFKKGTALGLVIAYFLTGPVSQITGSFTMWLVLISAGYLAFISK